MQRLKDKTAIITGASSGIGRAAAELFAQEGAAVVLLARRAGLLEEVRAVIEQGGGKCRVVVGDAADDAAMERAVGTAQDVFGGLDIAFNNAGTLGAMGPIESLDLEGWNDTLRTNLTSAFVAAVHQVPAMRKRGGGSIVFTSTFVGYTAGMAQMSAYAASKAGLIGLTQALATELGGDGIRVNALLPGGTDTDMGRVVASTPEAVAYVAGLHALGRLAQPAEIAQTALFLASEASSFTTGSAVLVDGGVSIHRG
ncbi:MAG: SDR family oxidoreductase [Nannocystaceae bacterium]|nr:SDR family oxidoreductase [Nannocystaceae bacterium]